MDTDELIISDLDLNLRKERIGREKVDVDECLLRLNAPSCQN